MTLAIRRLARVPVWLLACLCVAGPAWPSPIFSGTAPNAWILHIDGTTAGEYTVGGSAWTTAATFGPGSVRFDHSGGPTLVPHGGGVRALVNLAAGSSPTLDPSLPSLSLVGLNGAILNLGSSTDVLLTVAE